MKKEKELRMLAIAVFFILCSIGWMYYGEMTESPQMMFHLGLIPLIIGTVLGIVSVIRMVV